jgi:hypothetical protein
MVEGLLLRICGGIVLQGVMLEMFYPIMIRLNRVCSFLNSLQRDSYP